MSAAIAEKKGTTMESMENTTNVLAPPPQPVLRDVRKAYRRLQEQQKRDATTQAYALVLLALESLRKAQEGGLADQLQVIANTLLLASDL